MIWIKINETKHNFVFFYLQNKLCSLDCHSYRVRNTTLEAFGNNDCTVIKLFPGKVLTCYLEYVVYVEKYIQGTFFSAEPGLTSTLLTQRPIFIGAVAGVALLVLALFICFIAKMKKGGNGNFFPMFLLLLLTNPLGNITLKTR